MNEVIPLVSIVLGLAMPVVVIVIALYFLSRGAAERQKTLRMMIEKYDNLSPELLQNLANVNKRPRTASDIRLGLILIALGLGLVALDLSHHSFVLGTLSGFAAIPGFVGVAFLILGLIGNRKA